MVGAPALGYFSQRKIKLKFTMTFIKNNKVKVMLYLSFNLTGAEMNCKRFCLFCAQNSLNVQIQETFMDLGV